MAKNAVVIFLNILHKHGMYVLCDIPQLRLLNTASNAIKLREGIKPITAIKILAQSTTS